MLKLRPGSLSYHYNYTGAVSANALVGRLAGDGIFPTVFLRRMRWTGAPYISLALFGIVSLAIYGTTGASLTVMSSMQVPAIGPFRCRIN